MLTAAAMAFAQPVILMEPPHPLEIHLQRARLSFEAEGNRVHTRPSGDEPASDDNISDWTPALGLEFEGSIYHPKLVQFDIATENGITWGKRHIDDGIGPAEDDDRRFVLQRYHADATVLRDKPYSLHLFGSKNREERDYDQFNRFDVDTETYGAALRGIGPRWNWNVRYAHDDEQVANPDRPSTFRDDTVSVDAGYRRGNASETRLHYYDQTFHRQDDGTPAYYGVQRTLSVVDEANYSTNRDDRLQSLLTVSDLDENLMDSQSLTFREDWRHRVQPRLWNGASYQYDRREIDGVRNDLQNGEIYLEHRLDKTLASRADVQGERGDGDADTFTRVGPGLGEAFTQRLSPWSRLNIDVAGRWDHITRSTPGGAATIVGEDVRLDDNRPSFLAHPNVRPGSVAVTAEQRTRRFVEGIDYRLISRGTITEIQRVFGGAIPNGTTVQVDYAADDGGSETLDRLTRRTGAELDLYDRLLFLYAEQRAADSLGGDSGVYQDYDDTVVGLKNRWSWLELGVEHVEHSAETFGYDGVNYYADLFRNGEYTTAKLHAGRSMLDYRNQDDTLDTRSYTAMLGWMPRRDWSLQAFAGQYKEHTLNGDRTLRTLEPRLLYRYKRLSVDATYRYEQEELTDRTYERRYFLVRIIRDL